MNAGASTCNGGIRIFDTTNPFQPQEVADYIPRILEGAVGDVPVDENGVLYVVDRLQGGLYILVLSL